MELDGESHYASGLNPSFGAIFMSNIETKEECFRIKTFGLPYSQSHFVEQITEGMVLFLFEFERRMLFGVFQACSDGAINIAPNAFKNSGKHFPAQVFVFFSFDNPGSFFVACVYLEQKTLVYSNLPMQRSGENKICYIFQVKFKVKWRCRPLYEQEFHGAIKDNYYSPGKFNFGLSRQQVHHLLQLFSSRRSEHHHHHINSTNLSDSRLFTQPLLKVGKNIKGVINDTWSEREDRRCNTHHDQMVRDSVSSRRPSYNTMDGEHISTFSPETHLKKSTDGIRYNAFGANRTGPKEPYPLNNHGVSIIEKNTTAEPKDNERALSDGNIMYMTSEYSTDNTHHCHSTGCIHDNDANHSSVGIAGGPIPEDDELFVNNTNEKGRMGRDFHPHLFTELFPGDSNDVRSGHSRNEAGHSMDSNPFFFEKSGSPLPQQNQNDFVYSSNKNLHQVLEKAPYNGEGGRHGFQHLPPKPWDPAMDVITGGNIPRTMRPHFHEELDHLAYRKSEMCCQCSIPFREWMMRPYFHEELDNFVYPNPEMCRQCSLPAREYTPDGVEKYVPYHPSDYRFYNCFPEGENGLTRTPYEQEARFFKDLPLSQGEPPYSAAGRGKISNPEFSFLSNNSSVEASSGIEDLRGPHLPPIYPTVAINPLHFPHINGSISTSDVKPGQDHVNLMYGGRSEGRVEGMKYHDIESGEERPNSLHSDMYSAQPERRVSVFSRLSAAASTHDSDYQENKGCLSNSVNDQTASVDDLMNLLDQKRKQWVGNNTHSLPQCVDEAPATVDVFSPVTDDPNEGKLIVDFKRRSKLQNCEDITDVKNEESAENTSNKKRRLVRPSFVS